MTDFSTRLSEEFEADDLALFERIKDDPNPKAEDLWHLSEERFIKWRRRHDLPKLLAYFDDKLPKFKEWKAAHALTNELILETGRVTDFLERKPLVTGDTTKFFYRQTGAGVDFKIVAQKEIEPGLAGYTYELIGKFVAYFDWMVETKEELPDFNISRGFSPYGTYNASLQVGKPDGTGGFTLLRMGFVPLPVTGLLMLYKGKFIEFANLSNLAMNGAINPGGFGSLSCAYCACNDWTGDRLDFPFVRLQHCVVDQLRLTNSNLENWVFYDCVVTGSVIGTNLSRIRIFGGHFDPDLRDCILRTVHILDDQAVADDNLEGYKMLKILYAEQGDDEQAKAYYVKEMEWRRKHAEGYKRAQLWVSRTYWQYGSEPSWVIGWAAALVIGCAFIYWLNGSSISDNLPVKELFTFGKALYFSTTTFTTVGYGDFSPLGGLRVITSIEAFLGIFSMGFLVAGYASKKY